MSKTNNLEVLIQPNNRLDRRENHPPVSNFRVFLITAFVAFGGFLFGYDCVIGGGLPEIPRFVADFGKFSDPLKGIFVSILSIGTFFGALSASQFCDRWGRKVGLLITCGIFSIGIAVQTAASSVGVMMLGRLIAGYGVGLVSVMVPLYQSECTPSQRRGTIVSCYQLAITIGLLIGQIVAWATKDKAGKDAYRILIGLQFLWSGVLGVAMLFFPETPRFLIRAKRWDEAVRAKCRLSGLPPNHPHVIEELEEIKGNFEHEMSLGPATYAQCWQGNNFRRTLLGIFMQAWQQLTGVNFIFYFGPMFFKTAGIEDSFLASMIMGTVNCLFTFPGLYLVDRVGRRKLLLWGAAVQLASQFLVGIIHHATHGTKPIWTAIFCGTFVAAFASTWGPCAWVITSELFGLKTRAKQMSFAVAGNWGFNAVLGTISPIMSGNVQEPKLGVNVAFIWGALNVGCFLFVYFLIPELKGLSLEQVDELFEEKISPRDSASWIPTRSYRGTDHELKNMPSGDIKEQAGFTHRENV